MTVQEVVPGEAAGTAGGWRAWLRRPGRSGAVKVDSFLRDLSTLLGVGIPLVDAIDTIHSQHRGRFAASLLTLRERVSAGAGLADAMREQPDMFDAMCVSVAEVGENAGTLDVALERVAEFKERSAAFRNRLGTALLYPAVVLTMALGVSVLLMTAVVPNLLATIQDSGRPLPLPTRIVKAASDWLVGYWWLLLLGLGVVVAAARMVFRTAKGKMLWHRFLLRIPIAGELARKQAIVRVCIVLSTLLRSGLVFVRSVQIARQTASNLVLAAALERCEQAVQTGRDIAEAMRETAAFPPLVVRVFAVGQQSGRMEEMLDRLASDYDRQVTAASQRLTAVLEPILILFLVVLVGFISLATILPLLEAANAY